MKAARTLVVSDSPMAMTALVLLTSVPAAPAGAAKAVPDDTTSSSAQAIAMANTTAKTYSMR